MASGAVRAQVRERILRFAESLRLPIVLTPMAKGMVAEDHVCYAGVVFHALSDLVGETHRESDLVIAVGYDPVEFNLESWIPKTALIAIDTVPADVDPAAASSLLNVTGDIAAAVEYLADDTLDAKDWDLEALAKRRQAMFAKLSVKRGQFGPVAALEVLRAILPLDGIMTCDVGAHTHLIGQKWPTPCPGLQIMSNGWSTMGFGIPSGIAASSAARIGRWVCVAGDGGFYLPWANPAVAVRLNLEGGVRRSLSDNDLALIRIKQQKKANAIYGTEVRVARRNRHHQFVRRAGA